MSWVTAIVTIAAAASAAFAGVGLWFAGGQLKIVRRQHDYDLRVANDGVAVSWRALEAPHSARPDGTAQWLYEIGVQNPGRLPIQNIKVQVVFPCEVIRIRSTGPPTDPVAS